MNNRKKTGAVAEKKYSLSISLPEEDVKELKKLEELKARGEELGVYTKV